MVKNTKLKGAFYPRLMKMASYKTQVDLNCDPEVLRYFSGSMIMREHHPDEPIHIYEMEISEWEKTEKLWTEAANRSKAASRTYRETNPELH